MELGHLYSRNEAADLGRRGVSGIAATGQTTGKIPVAALATIFGIDRFMSEIRTLTNFIGNTVGTLVVAKWDGALDESKAGEILAGKRAS